MARTRTQKVVSKRIDLGYIKRPTPLRTGRKVLAFIAGGIAIVAITFLSLGGDGKLHNPGALTNAHAAWQNNCNVCHTGSTTSDGAIAGGFAKTVSDAACLQCHDGSLHHANQPKASLATFATPENPAHQVSKDCVSCHTEHRGHEMLVASDSRLCIDCHSDLSKNSQKTPMAMNRAVAFTKADHPAFGRKLGVEGKMVDPTVLKFNHAKHNGMKLLADNCTACHSVNNYEVETAKASAATAPPYALMSDAVVNGKTTARVDQVSYERHCIGCHSIELPGSVPLEIPHRELAEVRGFLAGVGNAYGTKLAGMSGEAKQKELVTEIVTGRPPRQKKEKKVITEAEWVDVKLKDLGGAVDKAFGAKDAKYNAIKKALPAPSTQPSGAAAGPDVNALEHFVTYGIASNCAYCHTVQGDVPVIALRPSGSATAPMTPAVLAFTTPTGVTADPRTWFTGAHFDHRSHRSMTCLDCHNSARTSKDTADVNSPNIDTASASGVSCLSCHSPASNFSGVAGSAGSDCTTCHTFHNRSAERTTPGSMALGGRKSADLILPDSVRGSATTRPVADGK